MNIMILEQLIQLRTIVECNGSQKVLDLINEALDVETVIKRDWNGG